MCVRYSTCADPRPTPRRTAGQGARPPATGSWALAIRRRISEGGVRWCEAGTERKEIGVSPSAVFMVAPAVFCKLGFIFKRVICKYIS